MDKIIVTDHTDGDSVTVMRIDESPVQLPDDWAGYYPRPGVVTIERANIYRHAKDKTPGRVSLVRMCYTGPKRTTRRPWST